MMDLAHELWPINRSISGPGVRETLRILQREIPSLVMSKFASGETRGDWTTPPEWEVKEAYIVDPNGDKICDFKNNNLHLVSYSEPIDTEMPLEELREHLHTLPNQPQAIPYVTSYYSGQWGFCLEEEKARKLPSGLYRVKIDSQKFPGNLDYGEVFLRGRSSSEIVFSTYICHPSMANNEISGPVLAAAIADRLSRSSNHFSYRFLFLPETIGAVSYIDENLQSLRSNTRAGFILTCVGDERTYSYVPSRQGNTVADFVGLKVGRALGIQFERFSWLDRGSDERQFCWPGVDLPFASFIRSKYGSAGFPEYHTSLDLLEEVVTERGLSESLAFYMAVIQELESMRFPKSTTIGEPQLGRRGRYHNLSIKSNYARTPILDVLSFCDGKTEVSSLPGLAGCSQKEVMEILTWAEAEGLVQM